MRKVQGVVHSPQVVCSGALRVESTWGRGQDTNESGCRLVLCGLPTTLLVAKVAPSPQHECITLLLTCNRTGALLPGGGGQSDAAQLKSAVPSWPAWSHRQACLLPTASALKCSCAPLPEQNVPFFERNVPSSEQSVPFSVRGAADSTCCSLPQPSNTHVFPSLSGTSPPLIGTFFFLCGVQAVQPAAHCLSPQTSMCCLPACCSLPQP